VSDEVSLKEHLLGIMNERQQQVRDTLAAMTRSKAETQSTLALFISLLSLAGVAFELFHR
jgi:hypothetical protein